MDAPQRNVRDQTGDPGSMLELYRALIALRGELTERSTMEDAEDGVVAFRRGRHTVAVNTSRDPRSRRPPRARWCCPPTPVDGDSATLAPHEGRVVG